MRCINCVIHTLLGSWCRGILESLAGVDAEEFSSLWQEYVRLMMRQERGFYRRMLHRIFISGVTVVQHAMPWHQSLQTNNMSLFPCIPTTNINNFKYSWALTWLFSLFLFLFHASCCGLLCCSYVCCRVCCWCTDIYLFVVSIHRHNWTALLLLLFFICTCNAMLSFFFFSFSNKHNTRRTTQKKRFEKQNRN